MAQAGYVTTLLGTITDTVLRRVLGQAFDYVLGNLRFGVVTHQARAENFQAYFLEGTTPSDTGTFSIAHGLPVAPHVLVPVLNLRQPGAVLPRLEVAQIADNKRVYLKSADTNAAFAVLVE